MREPVNNRLYTEIANLNSLVRQQQAEIQMLISIFFGGLIKYLAHIGKMQWHLYRGSMFILKI